MDKVINSSEAGSVIGALLDDVQYHGERYIIERRGEPAAVIVPVHIYENWKRSRLRLRELIDEVTAAHADLDQDLLLTIVEEAREAGSNQINQSKPTG